MPYYGTTVYEPNQGIFYLIGGEIKNKKTNQIISYSQDGWRKYEMMIPRSSAMATIIYD